MFQSSAGAFEPGFFDISMASSGPHRKEKLAIARVTPASSASFREKKGKEREGKERKKRKGKAKKGKVKGKRKEAIHF